MRTPVIITDYADHLNDRRRFVQANYGDGEWSCILGMPGGNCNGELYTPDMQKALIKTIKEPLPGMTFFGSNPGEKLRDAVERWVLDNGCEQRAWVYKEIISGANAKGKLNPFITAVRRRRVVLIGPAHLDCRAVHGIWHIKQQVRVPDGKAFSEYDRIYKETLDAIKNNCADLLLTCAGMCAKPLIYQLGASNPDCTIIDMGATLDPYAGVFSRRAYRREQFQAAFNENIKGITLP